MNQRDVGSRGFVQWYSLTMYDTLTGKQLDEDYQPRWGLSRCETLEEAKKTAHSHLAEFSFTYSKYTTHMLITCDTFSNEDCAEDEHIKPVFGRPVCIIFCPVQIIAYWASFSSAIDGEFKAADVRGPYFDKDQAVDEADHHIETATSGTKLAFSSYVVYSRITNGSQTIGGQVEVVRATHEWTSNSATEKRPTETAEPTGSQKPSKKKRKVKATSKPLELTKANTPKGK